jgi:hypothetical protein
MKKIILTSTLGLLLLTASLSAQDVSPNIIAAFNKGNSDALSLYLAPEVSLVVNTITLNADKQKATDTLRQFFKENKVETFTVKHQGQRGESNYIIGTLLTNQGAFRVNCFIKRIQNKFLIHQIRIEKTNE